MRVIKCNSSKWVHETWPTRSAFAWQTGYGAFTVSQSQVEKVREYIRNQEEHHRDKPYQHELIALLEAHEIEYQEEDLWG